MEETFSRAIHDMPVSVAPSTYMAFYKLNEYAESTEIVNDEIIPVCNWTEVKISSYCEKIVLESGILMERTSYD